jgi:hypothetical protein
VTCGNGPSPLCCDKWKLRIWDAHGSLKGTLFQPTYSQLIAERDASQLSSTKFCSQGESIFCRIFGPPECSINAPGIVVTPSIDALQPDTSSYRDLKKEICAKNPAADICNPSSGVYVISVEKMGIRGGLPHHGIGCHHKDMYMARKALRHRPWMLVAGAILALGAPDAFAFYGRCGDPGVDTYLDANGYQHYCDSGPATITPTPPTPMNLHGTWKITVGSGTNGTINITGDILSGAYMGYATLTDATNNTVTEMFQIARNGNGFDFAGYNVTSPNWTPDHYRSVSPAGDNNHLNGISDDLRPGSTPTTVMLSRCGNGQSGLASQCSGNH